MFKKSTTTGIFRKTWIFKGSFFLSIAIPLILLMTSLEFFSYREEYFHHFQQQYHLTEVTGRSQRELDLVSKDLIDYLRHGERALMEKHFNEREITHMEDVFQLYRKGRILRNVLLIISVGILFAAYIGKNLRILLKKTSRGFLLIWLIMALFALWVVLDFNRAFVYFHELFFTNDLWILDPKTDWMIRLLPENFFSGIVLRVGISFLIEFILIHILFSILGKEKRNEFSKND